MITIPQAVEAVIKVKPFLAESLSEGIINVSSLARKIHPQVEKLTMKTVKQGAIVMALNRLVPMLDISIHKDLHKLIQSIGDIIVRSNLTDYTFKNSETLVSGHMKVFEAIESHQDVFYTLVRGVFESNLVISSSYEELVETNFANEKLASKSNNLSAITLKLPQSNIQVSGFYYYILKAIAWEGINIREVVSTTNEFTIIVNDKDVDRGFSVLKQLKNSTTLII